MGLMSTRLGKFVDAMASATVLDIEKEAYNESVLAQMADLNTEVQLMEQGVFADGTDTPDYSPFTIEIKQAKRQPYDHMTFRDTGETHSSIEYSFNNGELVANWEDEYELEENYNDFVGLTQESMDELKPEIAENIRDYILSKL